MSGQTHPTVQIPQVFTAALAASVYICVAQRLGTYFVGNDFVTPNGSTDWPELLFGCIPLLLVLLWTAKNSVDEFKSFGRDPGPAFSLGWTILFSTTAYISLATTASLLFDGMKPFWGLVVFFVLCTLWSWSSVGRYSKKQGSVQIDPKKHKRRKIWSVLYPLQAGGMCLLALNPLSICSAVVVVLLLTAFLWDAWDSETFSSTINVGA